MECLLQYLFDHYMLNLLSLFANYLLDNLIVTFTSCGIQSYVFGKSIRLEPTYPALSKAFECRKRRTRITPNTDIFHAVRLSEKIPVAVATFAYIHSFIDV